MDARLRRVNKEIADCKADKDSFITVDLVGDSPFHLVGSFPGPEDTPYAGGQYNVDIVIPDAYPFQPPKMKFITKVYHPNISSASGAICLDILKDACPEPSDPQDAEVAKHYMASHTSFDETARYWAEIYAGAPRKTPKPSTSSDSSAKSPLAKRDEIAMAGLERAHVEQFCDLGFPQAKVIDVLRRLNYRGANVANIGDDRIVEELLK
ncbi:hypothetical protein BS47DRAFT_1371433 [Hydnum rufescens UP504]|uniref:UBC core domain-containing protein n=1 Tax=Hydnum rufescens UP504 TaxID=1448309 RepID=A0A9P6B594_9AGAM|nr:hypothetical protein BS47DRAFT_1371433 [Hydnum rufescens UP504]